MQSQTNPSPMQVRPIPSDPAQPRLVRPGPTKPCAAIRCIDLDLRCIDIDLPGVALAQPCSAWLCRAAQHSAAQVSPARSSKALLGGAKPSPSPMQVKPIPSDPAQPRLVQPGPTKPCAAMRCIDLYLRCIDIDLSGVALARPCSPLLCRAAQHRGSRAHTSPATHLYI